MNFTKSILKTAISLSIITVGVGLFLLLGEAGSKKKADTGAILPVVEVVKVDKHRAGIRFTVDGLVVPHREIEVAAEVSGRIVFKAENCRTGEEVKFDPKNPLLKIDDSDYKLEVKRLSEEKKQARANLKELKVEVGNANNQVELAQEDLKIAEVELKRYVEVSKTNPDVFTLSEVDAKRRNELAARNSLQAKEGQHRLLMSRKERLESALALVQARLEKSELDLERCKIFAPINGVVVSKNFEEGGYVQKGNIIFSLQDTSKMEVECQLHMRQMHWLWQSVVPSSSEQAKKQSYKFPITDVDVKYSIEDTPFTWKGKLQRYDGAGIDEQTRMIPCRVLVDNPISLPRAAANNSLGTKAYPLTLMSKMFVEIQVVANSSADLVSVPLEALHPSGTVWVVRNGQLVATPVRVANREPDRVVIYQEVGGLLPGDLVVVSPLASPSNGMQVEVRAR